MILNLGCGRALAVHGNQHWLGRLSFWLKDRTIVDFWLGIAMNLRTSKRRTD